MQISGEGIIGYVLAGVLGLSTGASIMWPEHREIGIVVMAFSSVALVFLAANHIYDSKFKWRVPVVVVWLAIWAALIGWTTWYIWPSTKSWMPSIADYWKSDFPSFLKLNKDITVNYGNGQANKALVLKFNIYQDFTSNTKFIGFYVPMSDDTYPLCIYLANHYQEFMDQLGNTIVKNSMTPGDQSFTESKGLTFSGRIYIYYEWPLSDEDIGKLESYYKSKNLQVEFRGFGYTVYRLLTDKPVDKL